MQIPPQVSFGCTGIRPKGRIGFEFDGSSREVPSQFGIGDRASPECRIDDAALRRRDPLKYDEVLIAPVQQGRERYPVELRGS